MPTSRYRTGGRSESGSFSAPSTSSLLGHHGLDHAVARTPTILESLDELPTRTTPTNRHPSSPLIIDLVRTFFLPARLQLPLPPGGEVHCGCSGRSGSSRCWSTPSARSPCGSRSCPSRRRDRSAKTERSQCGHVFAQRAKAATVDTFPCPSVGAVQACLLMAYEGFGEDQDSTLWMYLGLAIRMAVDLGLQKKVGVKYQGEQDPWYTRTWASDAECRPRTSRATRTTR